jgi:hypothetical protein
MKEELDLWRSVTEVPDAAVQELHARVIDVASQTERRASLWWSAVAAGIVLALIPLQFLRPVESFGVRPLHAPAAPPMTASAPVPPGPLAKVVPPKPAEEVVWMRIETPDPEVVIYLVGSEGGGE